MLPRLDRLSLVANTGGFYALSEAEQKQVEEDDDVVDPVSFEKPTHVMTFRIQMDTPNPDGTSRYKYYSPESLWNWVRQDSSEGKLPHNPSQKILYEDWYTLYYNDPARRELRVPTWVQFLERESVFADRMYSLEEGIKHRLAAEERKTRELRKLLELDVPENERTKGDIVIVRWRFWVKFHFNYPQRAQAAWKENFIIFFNALKAHDARIGKHPSTMDAFGGGGEGTYGNGMAVMTEKIRPQEDRQFTWTVFAVRMHRTVATHFLEWVNKVIVTYSYEDFLRRVFGYKGLFGDKSVGCENDRPRWVPVGSPIYLPETCDVPTMTEQRFIDQPPSTYIDHAGGIGEGSYEEARMSLDYPFPPPANKRLAWVFWIKGHKYAKNFFTAQKRTKQMKKAFVDYMRVHELFEYPAIPEGRKPWETLHLSLKKDYLQLPQETMPVTIVYCKILLPTPEATVLREVIQTGTEEVFVPGKPVRLRRALLIQVYEKMFDVKPVSVGANAEATGSFPLAVDSTNAEAVPFFRPKMSEREYAEWGTETDEDSSSDEAVDPKRRRRARVVHLELDEDDYALIEENTGQRFARPGTSNDR